MNKEEVLKDIDALCRECNDMVDDIVIARLTKDDAKAAHVHWRMESLVFRCCQELSFLRDYINEKVT